MTTFTVDSAQATFNAIGEYVGLVAERPVSAHE